MKIIKTERGYKIEDIDYGEIKYDNDLKRWVHYLIINSPIVDLGTNNCEDNGMRKLFRVVPWAKLLYQEDFPNWDEDPYGRRVQRGWISWEIWDLRELFGMSDRLLDEVLEECNKSWVTKKMTRQ